MPSTTSTPSAYPTPITPPRVPLIDERTGLIDRAWYMFFISLFRNAETTDAMIIGPSTESLIASYDEALRQLGQYTETLPPPIDYTVEINEIKRSGGTQPSNETGELQQQINTVRQDLQTLPAPAVVELQQQVDTLRQEVQTAWRPELGTFAALQQANLSWVTFDTTPQSVPTDVGTVAWDGGTTLGVQATANVLMQVGEAEYAYVKASAAITKGELCYHTGSVGASGVITAAPTPLALADPNQIVGVAAESIALNGFGLIQVSGTLRGFNTTGASVGEVWADGDPLYYNPAYVGGLTKTKPSAPNQKTYIGEVINASSSGSGSISIRIVPGSVLGGTDSNVQFGTLANNDLIQYSTSLGYWRNIAATSVTVGFANNLTGGLAGSLPYQSAVNTTTFLGIGTALQVLKVNSGATAPEWVSGAALTKVDDTNVTLTLGGTPATSLLAATSLTLGWTGQLSLTRGGTNASLTASAGSVAYSTASALALNTAGNSGDWLKSAGTSAPVWTAPAALTKTDDTNVTLTLGGSPTTALLNAASLTLGWSGQLSVSRGGTGLSSGTSGGIPYYSGTSTLASSALLASNALMVGGGAGGAPSTVTTGTGVVTALGVNTGVAGAFVVNGGALGTPSSGTVTNLTGTANISINGSVGSTTPNTGAFTTLSASSTVTFSGGTVNGVLYLNGSKVATSGSALTFDGTTLTASASSASTTGNFKSTNTGAQVFNITASNDANTTLGLGVSGSAASAFGMIGTGQPFFGTAASDLNIYNSNASGVIKFGLGTSFTEQMRITSTGLGIGTSSPAQKLDIAGNGQQWVKINNNNNAGANSIAGIQLWGNNTYRSALYYNDNAGATYLDTTIGTSQALYLLSGSTLGLSASGANVITFSTNGSERARVTSTGNVVAGGSAALATNATDGFLYVPTCAGTPTGTPTAITGMAPIVVNTTNNKLYFYSGGAWRDAGP